MNYESKLIYLESCAPDFLPDHHNREGELLLSVPVDASDTFESVMSQLEEEARRTEPFDDAFPPWVFMDAFHAFKQDDPRRADQPFCTFIGDDDDASHWFLFTWRKVHDLGVVYPLADDSDFGSCVIEMPGGKFCGLAVELRTHMDSAPSNPVRFSTELIQDRVEAFSRGRNQANLDAVRREDERGEVVYVGAVHPVRRKTAKQPNARPDAVSYVIENPDKRGNILANAYVYCEGDERPWRVTDASNWNRGRRYRTEAGALARVQRLADGKA